MKTAFLFPGQGAQHVGMGEDLCGHFPAAAELFDRAEAITALPLKELCFHGPEEELGRTDIGQPAIFTLSMATLAVLEDLLGPERMPRLDYCAGLSLGEYTALCAAGAIGFEDALALVTKRGRYMQAAAVATPSGMVCLVGGDEAAAEKVCAAAAGDGVLVQANFNCPGQIVLSGTAEACERAVAVADACGAGGAVPLKVAGAFHSPLMQPAAEKLAAALAEVTITRPEVPVLSNVTAQPVGEPEEIRASLLAQLTAPVRWQQNCEYLLAAGAEAYLEIGPGRVLAGLMRRIDRGTRVKSLNSQAAVEKFVAQTRGQVAGPGKEAEPEAVPAERTSRL